MAALLAVPAHAALTVGAKAPDFKARASIGGKQFDFRARRGTQEGTGGALFLSRRLHARLHHRGAQFRRRNGRFFQAWRDGDRVSHDTIQTLDKFSLPECRSKFPVAADGDGRIMKNYDSVSNGNPEYAQRTSYVIAPDGQVLYTYTAADPTHHVELHHGPRCRNTRTNTRRADQRASQAETPARLQPAAGETRRCLSLRRHCLDKLLKERAPVEIFPDP